MSHICSLAVTRNLSALFTHLARGIKLRPQRMMGYLQRSTYIFQLRWWGRIFVPRGICPRTSAVGAHGKEIIGNSRPEASSIPSRIPQMGTGTLNTDYCVCERVILHVILQISCLNSTALTRQIESRLKRKGRKKKPHRPIYTQLAEHRDPDSFSFQPQITDIHRLAGRSPRFQNSS
jgi:hypothetical protein